MPYTPQAFESKWQKAWQSANAFKTGTDKTKPKKFILDMFPYPSAAGLHVGHPLGYTATDIVARYYRHKGYNVLHPMGWDAFGLPAEQHAIETGEHPAKLTYANISNFKRQLTQIGFSYDWDREVATCDPSYYKWTQKIFTVLYEKGLAYQAEVAVNWCPALKTVLANEEVIDGKSERGDHPVYRVPMRQWMLKITDYADRLLADLDKLDWPENIKEIQRNWIGKSTGARIAFSIEGTSEKLEVFTTRPDTLYGVTYMVVAPEHPLLEKFTTADRKAAVAAYRETASRKSDRDRTELNKEKTGEFTGGYVTHPLTQTQVPVYISDYVMMGYGTGAIMAVPAHDSRDHAFAKKFGIPIVQVVQDPKSESKDSKGDPKNPKSNSAAGEIADEAFEGLGVAINSPLIDGLSSADAKAKMISELVQRKIGEATTNFKLRDWLFSRQRYWGEPIPVLKNAEGAILRCLTTEELPLALPEVQSYEPTGDGKSPLSAITSWVERKDEKGNTVYVETDTMPGSAGSSWYFLRYCDPKNESEMFSKAEAAYWMPVDLYVGGQEHAVGHLLYARFWTKVLFDAGLCPVDEPFQNLVNQGMITRDGSKMSKSKGNGVSPDVVIQEHGADALRVYEMFMGPFTQTKDWQESNLSGVGRFLGRVERLFLGENGESHLIEGPLEGVSLKDKKLLHKTLKKISEDIESMSFNTAVSQMMIFVNGMYETGCRNKDLLKSFLIALAPFAPHLSEELWLKCYAPKASDPLAAGYSFASQQAWPAFDLAMTIDDEIKMGVQVNGKHRGEIEIAKDASQEVAVAAAKTNSDVNGFLEGKEIKKIVYVAGRILNFVVS